MEWLCMNMKKNSCFVAWAFVPWVFAAFFITQSGAAELHSLELESPSAAEQRAYLGITSDTFTLADVQADILIIELFSLYCAMCAKQAPAAAELFSLAQKTSEPQRKIIVLGIGAGNSADEVARFQKQHAVPFPLVPDQKVRVARSMNMAITPGFIAFKKQPDGSLVSLAKRLGVLGPPQRFLDSALQAAAALP
jgi:hypothetical protein